MNDSATVKLLANGSARIFGQLMLLMYIVGVDCDYINIVKHINSKN